jgi:hypothetical protein
MAGKTVLTGSARPDLEELLARLKSIWKNPPEAVSGHPEVKKKPKKED